MFQFNFSVEEEGACSDDRATRDAAGGTGDGLGGRRAREDSCEVEQPRECRSGSESSALHVRDIPIEQFHFALCETLAASCCHFEHDVCGQKIALRYVSVQDVQTALAEGIHPQSPSRNGRTESPKHEYQTHSSSPRALIKSNHHVHAEQPALVQRAAAKPGLVSAPVTCPHEELFGLISLADSQHSDLIPGVYEGGLKIWECAFDLVRYLARPASETGIWLRGSRVLELGCGAGLPAISALLQGAESVCFQDFNAEVLKFITIPNVLLNEDCRHRNAHTVPAQPSLTVTPSTGLPSPPHTVTPSLPHTVTPSFPHTPTSHRCVVALDNHEGCGCTGSPVCRCASPLYSRCKFVSGDWSDFSTHETTLCKRHDDVTQATDAHSVANQKDEDFQRHVTKYDVVMTSETIYSVDSQPKLLGAIKALLSVTGVALVAAKSHYFGVGGSVAAFLELVHSDGAMETEVCHLVESSIPRKVLRLWFKQPRQAQRPTCV